MLFIQNPGKKSSISSFHRKVVIVIVTPEVVVGVLFSVLPFISNKVFDTSLEFDIPCFPIRSPKRYGETYGVMLVSLWWILILIVVVCDVIIILKLWKYNNRVNLTQHNVWQSQLLLQGKLLVKQLIIEHIVCVCEILLITVAILSKIKAFTDNATWIVMTTLALSAILHGALSNICNVMWTSCCCDSSVKEPQRKLKTLELIKIEALGKIRMKATWSIGSKAIKRGLMKVYGVNHLKSWAQEIVMLGMMRRTQHPSLLQCLWTNSSNPYYETMTMISGEIITSDSRIICLELTNCGTLQDYLQKAELPLPEPCQRMIIHDVAEGLFYLHHENILHNNLTSSCVYLKGSLQSMVLRAAVGDFEDAEIYGTLQQSLDSSIKDKRYFFLPDIRSFAIISLEIVSSMCDKKFHNRHVNYNSDNVPMRLNLEQVISDDDDEFEAQYCYNEEDTHRMFESIHSNEDKCDNDVCCENNQRNRQNLSLENEIEQSWSKSVAVNGRKIHIPDKMDTFQISDSETECDVNNCEAQSKSNSPSVLGEIENSVEMKIKNQNFENSDLYNEIKIKGKKDDLSLFPNRLKSTENKHVPPKVVETNAGQVRCTSPDPMEDQKLQELRKETKKNLKRTKTDKKQSMNKAKNEENLSSKSLVEAFVKPSTVHEEKRKDGNSWLSKPSILLKSITSNDTAVSVFKAKTVDDENYGTLDAIQEEDASSSYNTVFKSKQSKNKAEVWDIIDEQYYTQVSKKASHQLKKTISSESKSSLWSFISTPEDMDDKDLDDILECLPGMAEPLSPRGTEITVDNIIAERTNAMKREDFKKKFSFTDLSKSKFELIDYYEMLKARKITFEDVPEEKREMLINVIELKMEEKLKRDMLYGKDVLRSDEMYDHDMNPVCYNKSSGNTNAVNGKAKFVSFRQNQCHSSPHHTPAPKEHDPRIDRSRSAPLKRPRTPMHKAEQTVKQPEINQSGIENKVATVAKRNKARAALKRALNSKGHQTIPRNDRKIIVQPPEMNVRFATVRKINVNSADNGTCSGNDSGDLITVPVPTSQSFSITCNKPNPIDIKRYPSGSDSTSSLDSSVCHRADVSLTSGEMSSLSSQAGSDHYETDAHLTDTDQKVSKTPISKRLSRTPNSKVDSGFDSGSMSSEMSDAFMIRKRPAYVPIQSNSNGMINSWARNYKMIDNLSSAPYDFQGKLPPFIEGLSDDNVDCIDICEKDRQTKSLNLGCTNNDALGVVTDTDSGVNIPINIQNVHAPTSKDVLSQSKSSYGNVSGHTVSRTGRQMSRSMSPSFCPMSSPSRIIDIQTHQPSYLESKMPPFNHSTSRPNKPLMSNAQSTTPQFRTMLASTQALSSNTRPTTRPMSPNSRPLSPNSRPFSPNSRPFSPNSRPFSPNSRLMSPTSRPMSPNSRPMSSNSRPMSPNNRPMSPNGQLITANVIPTDIYSTSNTRARSEKHRSRVLPPSRESQLKMETIPFSPGRKLSKPMDASSLSLISAQQTAESGLQSDQLAICNNLNMETVSVEEEQVLERVAKNATRRYRQLVKNGVPMRATVIEPYPSRVGRDEDQKNTNIEVRPGTADSIYDEAVNDQELFENLDSKGFFTTHNRSPIPLKKPQANHTSKEVFKTNVPGVKHSKQRTKMKIPLDQIVREEPNGSSNHRVHRSSSLNHLTVTEEACLNQPTSEDSETCSIKTNKSNLSTPSGSKPKLVIDAELVIDRIFSQNSQQDSHLDVEADAELDLDKDPFKSVQELYLNDKQLKDIDIDHVELLNGVSQMHIHRCHLLASSLPVINLRDLFPASENSFDNMGNRLKQLGNLGAVGNQLLDIIRKCWLQEMPPTSGDLVEQLTDPVTETEL